jgi:hypothetical protein
MLRMHANAEVSLPIRAILCVLRECGRFFKRHWFHFVLMIPGAVLYTMLHEGMHAIAVMVQGGRVIEFVWLPSSGEWGHIRYEFPPGVVHSSLLISLAPYFLAAGLLTLGCFLALLRRSYPRWVASSVFIWMFLVPVADTANAAFPYVVYGRRNDFFGAFGSPTLDIAIGVAAAGCAVAVLGFGLQRRLYRGESLSGCAYGLLGAVSLALLFIIFPPAR